ncbi:uncharacterized protein SPPG_05013 [Spizellomyces punctatus DAOM BR117]|uniref:Probable RNA-binding protein 18 n=1 Tax=Spizellomyces punctatus (strain DAOM BR117) TaxID=645134 RepID=A0A0L0HEX0_SPIPD|nr:uncharacterized protein SPPG_05013 [Spizellomyces punctatus DAOM BR117]KNC99627.1 hypothetical protein SPPG_05013 [Spizellomyces punctatus DAOM BR117]|eukprot:XP_016607667.1 hypothetical protein SPPG_05013 [Spizellomyces punctatus DAOM BR117]
MSVKDVDSSTVGKDASADVFEQSVLVKPAPPPSVPAPITNVTPNTPQTRLYVGNLPPTLTEYNLITLFAPHGKIRKIDYLWHKHGPRKGEPRGYCFVEYERRVDAVGAVAAMNGRVVGGRKLTVGFSVDHGQDGKLPRPADRYKDVPEEVNLKLQPKIVRASTSAKISALERKIHQLSQQEERMANGMGNDRKPAGPGAARGSSFRGPASSNSRPQGGESSGSGAGARRFHPFRK